MILKGADTGQSVGLAGARTRVRDSPFWPFPEFYVVPDECSDVAKLVHDDLSIVLLGPFGETGANVDGKDAPIIHDIADIVGGGAVALKGSVLDHVHCEWLPPVGHFFPMAYFVGDVGNAFGSLAGGLVDSGIRPNWMLCASLARPVSVKLEEAF